MCFIDDFWMSLIISSHCCAVGAQVLGAFSTDPILYFPNSESAFALSMWNTPCASFDPKRSVTSCIICPIFSSSVSCFSVLAASIGLTAKISAISVIIVFFISYKC